MKRDDIKKTLSAVGMDFESLESPDGSIVLLLPHGGRVLGLFAPDDDKNFLWTHAALENVESARRFYESDVWHNSGGDRTWLAPEVDFFFPHYPKLDQYWQQRELDPGRYESRSAKGTVCLKNQAVLMLSRSQRPVELEITKLILPALNPLRYEAQANSSGLKYAGYTLRTTLQLRGTDGQESAKVGLWNLLQMPHGGDLLIPTISRSEPKLYMGNIGPEDLLVGEHLIRYTMRASGEHKLGIRAIAITGRIGYIYGSGVETSLIIRNFTVNPSGEYVDVPWLEPANFGFAFQACNVNSHLGAFSELEYHVPAIVSGTEGSRCEDESQVWAFRGPQTEVKSVAGRLLSSEIV